ncbi:MAG: nuclear transport factor 2 family protein [Chitinophagaceae bacterium]
MKKIIVILAIFTAIAASAQTRKEQVLIDRTYLLSNTIFGTKDSLTLEDLFARTATYGHSHGNLQTREEAVKAISANKSNYTDTSISKMSVYINGKTAITRHLFKANENKTNGTVSKLDFAMILVWVKEKGKWRLFGRQASNIGN